MFETQDKIRREWWGHIIWAKPETLPSLLLPIRLKSPGKKSDIFNQATFCPSASICQRKKGSGRAREKEGDANIRRGGRRD